MFQNMQPFSPGLQSSNPVDGSQIAPRVDVMESAEEIIYIFEVPGVELNTVNVEIGNSNLVVDAQVEMGLATGDLNYLYQERPMCKRYSRLLSIPPEVNHEEAKANVKNGILMVSFPKNNTGRRLSVDSQEQQVLQPKPGRPPKKRTAAQTKH
jgi:HSP20 family molecular chaperone IbpA